MPTTIATPSSSNTTMRFNEPYVSGGLNKKTVGAIPNGIIRGAILRTTGAGLNVQIEADPNTGDSIYTYTMVTGFQLTHRENGPRVLDLSAVAGQTVYVALYIVYSIGNPTIVEWRAYTEAELFGGAPVSEAGSVVIVGKVVVPAVGPIASTDVTGDRARRAWKDVSSGMLPWKQIVQNGGFEEGVGGCGTNFQSIPGYTGYEINAAFVRADVAPTALPRTGDYALLMRMNGVTNIGRIGPGAFDIADKFSSGPIPVSSGQLIDVSFWLRGSTIQAYNQGSSGARLFVEFFDAAGTTIDAKQVASDPSIHIGTFAYTQLDGIFEAPDNCYMRWYIEASADVGAGVSNFYIDDVSILLQPMSASDYAKGLEPSVRSSMLELAPIGASSKTVANSSTIRFIGEVLSGGVAGLHIRQGDGLNVMRWLDSIISGALDITDSSFGILGTPHYPQEDSTPTSFKVLHKYRIHSTAGIPIDARVYTSHTDFGYTITINAKWDPATSTWSRDDTTFAAAKFTVSPGFLRFQSHPAGAGSWSDGAWSASQSFRVNGVNGDLEYTSKVRRTRWIELQSGNSYLGSVFGNNALFGVTGSGQTTAILAGGSVWQYYIPILGVVPHGADLIDVKVGFSASGGSFLNPIDLRLNRTLRDDVTLPHVINPGQTTTIGATGGAPAQPYAAHLSLSAAGLPHTMDLETYEYKLSLLVFFQGGGAGSVYYCKCVFDDPGPGGR